jgi:hypothetical protein
VTVAVIEIVLAAMIIWNPTKMKHLPAAAIAFFLFAIFGLDMPASNHQSLGFAVISGWLLLISFQKASFDLVKNNRI